jgi:hypothetical protein
MLIFLSCVVCIPCFQLTPEWSLGRFPIGYVPTLDFPNTYAPVRRARPTMRTIAIGTEDIANGTDEIAEGEAWKLASSGTSRESAAALPSARVGGHALAVQHALVCFMWFSR